MVTERNLVASEFLCLVVEIATAHAGAQIARGFFDAVHRIKDLRLKNRHRNSHEFRIVFNDLAVCFTVSRVHHKKDKLKRELVVTAQFLKQLCHQHRIFSAGDTDCDLVALFHKFILIDRLGKTAEQLLVETLANTLFYVRTALLDVILLCHLLQNPAGISLIETVRIIAKFIKFIREIYADYTANAVKNNLFLLIEAFRMKANLLHIHVNRSRNKTVLVRILIANVDQLIASLLQFV